MSAYHFGDTRRHYDGACVASSLFLPQNDGRHASCTAFIEVRLEFCEDSAEERMGRRHPIWNERKARRC